MPGKFHHESIFRGSDFLSKASALHIAICGVGAIGSNLAESLARQGFANLRAIDRDRVEEQNLSTQVYTTADIGQWKVDALKNRIFRSTGDEIETERKELTPENAAKLLAEANLVVDAFDNSASRSIVQQFARTLKVPCLHVGLTADYGEVIWDDEYKIPADVGVDVCDYPLARNIALLTVTVAAEVIVRFAMKGDRQNYSVTLGDFAIREIAE